MAVSINTFFGDYLLGLFVTWTSTPSADSGSSDIDITLKANLRSKLHVYGYDGTFSLTDYTPDVAANYDVFVSYADSTNAALWPGQTAVPASEAELYKLYIAWQNPDSQGTVTYDGIEAKAYLEVTPAVQPASLAALQSTPPTLTVKLQDNSTTGKQFDIHPQSAYASGSTVEDGAQSGTNNVGVVAGSPTDICTEKWYLSLTAIACVEMTANLKRKRNTGDTAHDIVLDFQNTFAMHAAVGRNADSSDEALKFEAQNVDFTQFYTSTTTASAFNALSSAGSMAVVAIAYSLAF